MIAEDMLTHEYCVEETCCRVFKTTMGYKAADTPENKAAPRKKNFDLSNMFQSISFGMWISEDESSSVVLKLIFAIAR